MVHTICTGLCVFLMILGFVDFLRMCTFLILKAKGSLGSTVVVPIKGSNENAEFILRSEAAKILWNSYADTSHLICLDCGMDFETRQICSLVCRDYDFMDICCIDDFEAELGSNPQN